MRTGDLDRLYGWSVAYLWAENISRILWRFGFLICMIIGEQGCYQFWSLWRKRFSSDFGDIILDGRDVFSLKISYDKKIT
jgi:hypothetical protein